jgi:hypothetical protein
MGSWTYSYDGSDPRDAYFYSAVFSCFLSLLVCITFVLFRRLQNKPFMKIITLISFCDCIANASILNGVPNDRGWCVLQALVGQFFFPASWIWTTILTYLLYSLVVHGKISMPEWQMHAITWGICILITVLPLTTSTYGRNTDDDDWCFIQSSSRPHTGGEQSVNIWAILTVYCIIFVTFALMTIWGLIIIFKLKFNQGIQKFIPFKLSDKHLCFDYW